MALSRLRIASSWSPAYPRTHPLFTAYGPQDDVQLQRPVLSQGGVHTITYLKKKARTYFLPSTRPLHRHFPIPPAHSVKTRDSSRLKSDRQPLALQIDSQGQPSHRAWQTRDLFRWPHRRASMHSHCRPRPAVPACERRARIKVVTRGIAGQFTFHAISVFGLLKLRCYRADNSLNKSGLEARKGRRWCNETITHKCRPIPPYRAVRSFACGHLNTV